MKGKNATGRLSGKVAFGHIMTTDEAEEIREVTD